ncbi:MAG: phosphotransferase [Planctomycetes bacterium]|nr:phosphotransferase [Planctomycetota bacterium]
MIAPLELASWYPALLGTERKLVVADRRRDAALGENEVLVHAGRRRPACPPGARVQRWSCFPGTGGGFVLLDAEHRRVFRAGTRLLPGGRAWTRLAGKLVRASSRLGLHAQLAPRTLALVDLPTPAELALHRRFPGLPADLAWNVASGVPGRDQKSIVQLTTLSGDVVAYAKLGTSPHARACVVREAAVLDRLRSLDVDAPRALGCETTASSSLLVQTALEGERAPGVLGPAHWHFLDSLERATGTSSPLERIPSHVATLARLRELEAHADEAWLASANELASALRRAAGARPLPCALAHGDFTPWNVVVAGPRARAFDWEHARDLAPALFDALHFTLQQALLVDRVPHGALHGLLEARTRGSADSDWLVHLGAYLLDLAVSDEQMQLEQRSPFVQVEWLRTGRLALMRELVQRFAARGARAA